MGAPDPHTSGNLMEAVKYGLGLIGGGVLTAFAKNYLTMSGSDGREIRQELREELKRLRDERALDHEEMDALRDDVKALRSALEDAQVQHAREIRDLRLKVEQLTIHNQRLLIGRTEARALLNAMERRHSIVETPWPEDPEGGTP